MHSLSSSRQETQVVVMARHLALRALHFMAPLLDGLFFSLPTPSQPIVSRACILHPEEAARFLHHLAQDRGQDWSKQDTVLVYTKNIYTMILLPLRPDSLMHKNPQRCKIIHAISPVGRKARSIDLNVCICRNIPFQ